MNLGGTISRGNTALPACPAQSSMVELFAASESHVHSPILGTQPVYVAIKQVVALCSQTPFKCSIAGPPERVRVCVSSMAQKTDISKLWNFFSSLSTGQGRFFIHQWYSQHTEGNPTSNIN